MTSDAYSETLDSYVAALVDLGGQLQSIVTHMVQFGAAGAVAPDAATIPETLRKLFVEVLGPALEQSSVEDLRAAAVVLERTSGVIEREIYLVPPPPRRRANRPRARRRIRRLR